MGLYPGISLNFDIHIYIAYSVKILSYYVAHHTPQFGVFICFIHVGGENPGLAYHLSCVFGGCTIY